VLVAPVLVARGPMPLLPQQQKSVKLATRLYAASLAALLVASLNVAALLMLRAVKRRHEMAARMAVGASSGDLLALLTTETLMLGALAGMIATLVGKWGTILLERQSAAAVWAAPGLDFRIMVAAITIALLAALGAGIFPARVMMGTAPMDALRVEGSPGDAVGARLRSVLLVAQTALAVALITSAGTFLAGLRHVGEASLGFDYEQIVSVALRPDGPPSASVVNDALSAIRVLPRVASATSAAADPFPNRQMTRLSFDGSDQPRLTSYNMVDAGFFETAGIRPLSGRAFTAADGAGSEAVAIVTRTAVLTFWGTPNALGRCVFGFDDPTRCRRVVGVIEDLRGDLAEPPVAHCLIPMAQAGREVGGVLLVRMQGTATELDVAAIRARVAGMAATVAESRISRPGEGIMRQLLPLRQSSLLIGLFGLLTLLAIAGGVYGSVGYEVSLRSRELGVRMALGATPSSLVKSVLAVRLRQVCVGVVLGGAAVLLMGPFLHGFLFDESAADLGIYVVVSLTIVLSAAAASLKPALQIASIDPVVSLRSG
jgi:predicted permease